MRIKKLLEDTWGSLQFFFFLFLNTIITQDEDEKTLYEVENRIIIVWCSHRGSNTGDYSGLIKTQTISCKREHYWFYI